MADSSSPVKWTSEQAKAWAFRGLLTALWSPVWLSAQQALNAWFGIVLPGWRLAFICMVLTALYFARQPFARLYYKWRVSHWSGITRVYAVHHFPGTKDPGRAVNPKLRLQAEDSIRRTVRSSDHVMLLLASGWHYIGCEKVKGKLYEVLSEHTAPFHLEVLVIDSANRKEVELRAAAAHITPEQYIEGMKAVLWTLALWARSKDWNVEVRKYMDVPIWQMVLNEREMWLTCARNTVTDKSPIYCLKRDASYGLHYGLAGVWERRWGTHSSPVDLANVPEPDWSKLKDTRAG